MSQLVKYAQAVGTLNIHPAGGGDSRDDLDAKINQKLTDEDWDEVSSKVVHLNKSGEEVTSVILLYEYKKFADDSAPKAKK